MLRGTAARTKQAAELSEIDGLGYVIEVQKPKESA
jgi:hypothetical protein